MTYYEIVRMIAKACIEGIRTEYIGMKHEIKILPKYFRLVGGVE